ncbi:MAG: hypothetical protein QM647_02280 [Asticcacaulis sp.]|uniref:hypothetical protein n=1 Tax=Asticcacaulis sp. TaxID=1872648 RepID=UPI0039E71C94
MEHEFLTTIRTYIFYLRVYLAGLLLAQTGIWFQWLDWKRYFPSFAYSDWHIGLMIATMVIGWPMYIYGMMKIRKPGMVTGVKSWAASLPETKRALNIALTALILIFAFFFGVIIIGIDDRNVIDYRSILIVAFTGTAWVAYAAELILPHTMPELRKVAANQSLSESLFD